MTSTKEYVQRDDGNRRANRNRRKGRCRRRLSTLLHTHVALILVCTLAALDSACVIGQIICDILIMKETLQEWEMLDTNLTSLLRQELPMLNLTAGQHHRTSQHSHGPQEEGKMNLEEIRDILWQQRYAARTNLTALTAMLPASDTVAPPTVQPTEFNPKWWQALQSAASNMNIPGTRSPGSVNVSVPLAPGQTNGTNDHVIIGFFKIPVAHSRSKRAAEGATTEHDILHDLTHSFHLGSMILLSMLLFETLLKVFAMGRKILHHKLEIFDAFVVSVSWALDVAFWEGIWAHPGTEAATILIFILPWRVVRIVNSFVLVIQEKDHVQLKIVKQRLRLSVKKSKESTRKASCYRTEVKQLQGLCRKYGAAETEINACGPTGRNGRRRSSLMPAMERAASLTLISALGSHPSLYTMDSSSDDDDDNCRDLARTVSHDPTLRSTLSVSTLDSVFTIEGNKSDDYLTSDNEHDHDRSVDGVDNPVFSGEVAVEDEDDGTTRASQGGERGGREDDPESGPQHLAERLHQTLTEQPSIVTIVSEASTTCDSAGAAEPSAQEVPPCYHEVISKQDSNTRL